MNVAGESFSRLIWPPTCQSCHKPTPESTGLLCRSCWDDILKCTASTYCPRCGRDASPYAILNGRCPDCVSTEYHFDGIARAGVYHGTLSRMIVAFKAADRTDLDPHFRLLANAALSAAPFAREIDLLVPVPLHWTRRLVRGYNHAHLIAKSIDHSEARMSTDIARMRRTQLQPGLSPARRAANVKGAFAVRRGHPFSDRTVCLVDDVKTTGATLNECATTLKAAGAKKVYALVIAVAGQHVD
jgi:competence protein ComFC